MRNIDLATLMEIFGLLEILKQLAAAATGASGAKTKRG